MNQHKIKLLFFFIIALLTCCSMPTNPKEAVILNDSIVITQDKFYQHIEFLFSQLEKDIITPDLRNAYNHAKKYVEKVHSKYSSNEPFDDEDIMRKATLEFFNSQKKLLENEYLALIAIKEKNINALTANDETKWDSIFNGIIHKDSIASNKFLKEQKRFSEQHRFELIELD